VELSRIAEVLCLFFLRKREKVFPVVRFGIWCYLNEILLGPVSIHHATFDSSSDSFAEEVIWSAEG